MMLRYFMFVDYMDKVRARIAEIREHETTLKSILVICFVGWSLTTWTGIIPSITVSPVQRTIVDHAYKGLLYHTVHATYVPQLIDANRIAVDVQKDGHMSPVQAHSFIRDIGWLSANNDWYQHNNIKSLRSKTIYLTRLEVSVHGPYGHRETLLLTLVHRLDEIRSTLVDAFMAFFGVCSLLYAGLLYQRRANIKALQYIESDMVDHPINTRPE